MKKKYVINILDGSGIDELTQACEERKKWLNEKTAELAKKLANRGYEVANLVMAEHVFSGDTIGSLMVEQTGENTYVVKANSTAILFLEFGTGIKGSGHPEAGENGMGAGTYPGQTHAFDPNGWWFPTDDERLIVRTDPKTGQGFGHSTGMAPAMPMYNAVKTLEQELDKTVREVFAK